MAHADKKRSVGLQNRINFFLVPSLFFIWFCVMIWRLCDLHLGEREPLSDRDFNRSIRASRGSIFDRQGNPIAVPEPYYAIHIDPHAPVNDWQSREKTAQKISELTGRKYHDVLSAIYATHGSNRYIYAGMTFSREATNLVQRNSEYCCVSVDHFEQRRYPQRERMAQVLGYLSGVDQVARNGGVEQSMDMYLKGTDGFYYGEKTKGGREIRSRRMTTLEPINGASVYLTIDQNIQYEVYEALRFAVTNSNAISGRAIVEKVNTGEILAMACYPSFDPENYRMYPYSSYRNRTVTDVYDPGSTMKCITIASALNEGFITPDSKYDVGNGAWSYGGHILRDHPKGVIDVRTIIAKSSNIGAAKIALDFRNNKLFETYLRNFGFASKSGINVPGEANGLLSPSEKWEMVKPTRVAMGQGISVTSLQLINSYCAIANGGRLMRPYLVSRVVSPNGEVLFRGRPEVIGNPIDSKTAATTRDIMKGVVDWGTGKRARVDGYTAAGKTGTAQMVVQNPVTKKWHYSETDYWSSFVGFVPAENPVFAVLVTIDRPYCRPHDGAAVAAPAFSRIASYTAQYLEIPAE